LKDFSPLLAIPLPDGCGLMDVDRRRDPRRSPACRLRQGSGL